MFPGDRHIGGHGMPSGTIARLLIDKGFGFIAAGDGTDLAAAVHGQEEGSAFVESEDTEAFALGVSG